MQGSACDCTAACRISGVHKQEHKACWVRVASERFDCAGEAVSEQTKEHCQVAAFGPWLAESLKCFHEWMDLKMPQQLPSKVSWWQTVTACHGRLTHAVQS
jgi:hypothetical protein